MQYTMITFLLSLHLLSFLSYIIPVTNSLPNPSDRTRKSLSVQSSSPALFWSPPYWSPHFLLQLAWSTAVDMPSIFTVLWGISFFPMFHVLFFLGLLHFVGGYILQYFLWEKVYRIDRVAKYQTPGWKWFSQDIKSLPHFLLVSGIAIEEI